MIKKSLLLGGIVLGTLFGTQSLFSSANAYSSLSSTQNNGRLTATMRDKAVDVLHAFDSQLSLLPGKLDKLITVIQASNSSTSSSQLTSQLTSQLREIAQEVKNLSETQKKVVKQQNKITERQQEINEQNKDCKAQEKQYRYSIFFVPKMRNGETKEVISTIQKGIKSLEEGKGTPYYHIMKFTCQNGVVTINSIEDEKIYCNKEQIALFKGEDFLKNPRGYCIMNSWIEKCPYKDPHRGGRTLYKYNEYYNNDSYFIANSVDFFYDPVLQTCGRKCTLPNGGQYTEINKSKNRGIISINHGDIFSGSRCINGDLIKEQ